MNWSRRGIVSGALLALPTLLVGGFGLTRLLGRHYPATPYDDLLDQVMDREAASVLGAEAAKQTPGVTAQALAARLRADGALGARAQADAATGRVADVSGWVVPQSVAQYAVLASLNRP